MANGIDHSSSDSIRETYLELVRGKEVILGEMDSESSHLDLAPSQDVVDSCACLLESLNTLASFKT